MQPPRNPSSQPPALQVRSYTSKDARVLDQEKIISGLVAGMPTYRVRDYFKVNPDILESCDILVIVEESGTGKAAAAFAADWAHAEGLQFLWLRFLFIAEKWQKGPAIKLALQQLFKSLVETKGGLPAITVLRTNNPHAFAVMAFFASIPGAAFYPFIRTPPVPALLPKVRTIAQKVAPGLPFIEKTGLLPQCALDYVKVYPSISMTGKSWIDSHFQAHVTLADFLLCCIFLDTTQAARRVLRAFGISQPHEVKLV